MEERRCALGFGLPPDLNGTRSATMATSPAGTRSATMATVPAGTRSATMVTVYTRECVWRAWPPLDNGGLLLGVWYKVYSEASESSSGASANRPWCEVWLLLLRLRVLL